MASGNHIDAVCQTNFIILPRNSKRNSRHCCLPPDRIFLANGHKWNITLIYILYWCWLIKCKRIHWAFFCWIRIRCVFIKGAYDGIRSLAVWWYGWIWPYKMSWNTRNGGNVRFSEHKTHSNKRTPNAEQSIENSTSSYIKSNENNNGNAKHTRAKLDQPKHSTYYIWYR